jgi:Xaa-Pro aminopeptidase
MLLPRSLLRTPATAAAHVVRKPYIASRAFHASAALRAIDMSKVDTTERLAELRKLMKERNVDIYSTMPWSKQRRKPANTHAVVPSEDSHQSEYIAPCDARRGQILHRLTQYSY